MTDSEVDLLEIVMRMVGTRRGGFVRRKGARESWGRLINGHCMSDMRRKL